MQGVASYQFTLSGSYKIREILYQLHYSKPEAYDNAEFHQAILRGKVPADNLQSKLRNDLPSHYRGKKKIKITISHMLIIQSARYEGSDCSVSSTVPQRTLQISV